MQHADIILNVVIALLLVITIVFCLVLSKRISAFNSNKNDLAKFLLEFSSSIQRAEKNINQLKELGSNVDENLKAQIKRARFLANDLSFLSEKGENVAQNLEGRISMSRDVNRKMATENSINSMNANRQQREILSGEEPTRPRPGAQAPTPTAANNQMSNAKRQALDALLHEIARKKSETK
jgi:hypothetical protein